MVRQQLSSVVSRLPVSNKRKVTVIFFGLLALGLTIAPQVTAFACAGGSSCPCPGC